MITDEQKKALEAPLDPKHVHKPNAGGFGPKGDYLEGWHVINEMNRVFGFDGWSYAIDLRRDDLREVEVTKNNQTSMQWQVAYTCVCTLTVGEVIRQDVGFGSGFAKGIGDAIEGATKEAATDSLKRAARTFGNVFGLALYDKSRANVGAPAIEMIADAHRDEIQAMIEGYGFNILKVCQHYKIANLKEIPASEVANVKAYLNAMFDKKKEKAA